MEDRCTVCANHTIGSVIILEAPMIFLGDEAQVGARFGSVEIVLVSVQDISAVCARRTLGSKSILGAPDGTPRSCGSCGISFRSFWRLC